MASLGFRPPQFSEEFAWLPTWLQNLQVEPSAAAKEPQSNTTSSQVETISREESKYNNNINFHLFLSGEDSCQNSFAPSPHNVLHLCLRLSSDGESLHSQSQGFYASQALHDSGRVMSARQVEILAGTQELAYLSIADDDHAVKEISPLTSVPVSVENIHPQFGICNNEIGMQHEEKVYHNDGGVLKNFIPPIVKNAGSSSSTKCKEGGQHEEKINVRRIKDVDVHDAVELSIAASEALVIHELISSGSASEGLLAGTILEAALRVKQVRLQALEEDIYYSSDEIDEIDSLADLDDSVMENAFLDVGLSFSEPDEQHACGSDMSRVKDTAALEIHHGHNNGFNHVQLVSEQDKMCNDTALPAEEILHVSAVARPQVDVSSSPACISENADAENRSIVADRFRSRWLGGWTVKEADASASLKHINTKGIPKFFDGETSFLSESADVAADENSFVHKHEAGSKIASLPSIPFEGVLTEADQGILVSQEAGSSNLSLVDPLCSVVPCSISSEDASFPLGQNQDDRETDAQNCFSTKSGFRMEKLQKMSDQNVESGYVDGDAVPKTTGECFDPPVRRLLASLKAYSTVMPKNDAILKGQKQQNQQLSLDCVGDLKQNQGSTVIISSVADHGEPAKDGVELPLRPSVQRRSSSILNQRTDCSELINLTGNRSPEQLVSQGTVCKAPHRKNLQQIKSKLKDPPSAPIPVRKRVCFSEVELELQQNKSIQKPWTSQRDCLSVQANKRSKKSKQCADSGTRDVKNSFTATSCLNNIKRLIFHGRQFLLTGFSSRKEREIIELIQDHGGMVLLDIPSPPSNSRPKRRAKSNFQRLPIVICSTKLQTTKFLYGCAVNALILKVQWLTDSIAARSTVLPDKYLILPSHAGLPYTRFGKLDLGDSKCIFDRVGIMLHGKHSFCTKLTVIIKHGGGQVFKTLHRLFLSLDTEKIYLGAIVAEDESRASRHLRHCALERKIPVMPASWIAKSLHFGKLLPVKEVDTSILKAPTSATSIDWSEEI